MLRSEYFLYRTKQLVNNFEIYYIATMNLSYSRKTYRYEYHSKPTFVRIKQKTLPQKFSQIFGKSSVRSR